MAKPEVWAVLCSNRVSNFKIQNLLNVPIVSPLLAPVNPAWGIAVVVALIYFT